ncbi:hypothetical protein SNE40_011160 [Patella caerulea]|uniref:Uncharacterized protein n=1 Tax=Patella caerulea TaxID=87958 RepID=A0AAN8JN39_PATCE
MLSFGNLQDEGTQGGHLILLKGKGGNFTPIAWNSKRIRRVVRSTLSGETLAMADAIDTGIFISTLYSELVTGCTDPTKLPLVCVTDNKSLLEAIKSTKCVTEKRLRLEITGIKEMVKYNQIKEIIWSETKSQLADCLTKHGSSALVLMKTLQDGVLKLKI